MNLLALLFARKEPILREQSPSVPKPSVDFATLLERMQKGTSTKLPQTDPLAKPQLWDTTIKNRPHPDIVVTTPKTIIKDHPIARKGKNFQDKKSKTFALSHKPLVRSFISSQATAFKSGGGSTKAAAKGAAPLAKSLETPKASQRFAKEEMSQTKNMDQVGQTPKTSLATLTQKQERTKIVEERPKSRPAQKDLAKGERKSVEDKGLEKREAPKKSFKKEKSLDELSYTTSLTPNVPKTEARQEARPIRKEKLHSSKPTHSAAFKSGGVSTKVAAKGAAPLAKSLEAPKASQRFAKAEVSQTKNMDQVGQTPKTFFATLTKKQERTKIVEERPKSRPVQKDLAKGVAREPATHMPPTQKEPAVQEPLPSNVEQKGARHASSLPHPQRPHPQKALQKAESSVTKPSKKSLPSKEPTIPEAVQTHLDKEISSNDGLMPNIAHPATHPSLTEAKKKSLYLDAKESPMAKTRSSGSKKKSVHLDEHPLGEELLQLSQKAEPITKEFKQRVEPSLHQSSFEDISNKTQHTAAMQDSLDQGGQSFEQHQDLAHTEHTHPQEPEPQIPELQKRIFTIRLDQTHININLTAKQLSLTFFSSATFHTDGNLGEFVEEVMQQSGFDKYKVTLKDRQKRIEILSKESRTSSSPRSVIDVKV